MVSHPLVFLVGKETALRDEEIHGIQKQLFKDASSRQLNTHFFDASDGSLKAAVDIARTAPFLAGKRLVVLKEIEELSKEDQTELLRMLAEPQPFAQWVLTTAEPKVTKSGFLSEVAKHSRVVSCEAPYREGDLRGWVRKQFQKEGKDITAEALELLSELCGRNVSELASKVEQLAVHAGSAPRIERESVEALVGPSLSRTAFDLYEAVARRDGVFAFETVRKLAEDGSKPIEILSALAWRHERNMKIKNLLAGGLPPADVGRKLGIHSYYLEGEIGQAKRMSAEKARQFIGILLACDGEIKRGLLEANLSLEKCLLSLCDCP